MIRVLVTDGMDKNAIEQLKKKGFQVTEQHYGCEELGTAIAQYDALVVRSSTQVRSCHIDQAKGSRLKLILRGGVGIDNIDAEYAEKNGYIVSNDTGKIEDVVKTIIAANPKSVADYKSGKEKALMAIFGQCMRELKGNCDPNVLRELILKNI